MMKGGLSDPAVTEKPFSEGLQTRCETQQKPARHDIKAADVENIADIAAGIEDKAADRDNEVEPADKGQKPADNQGGLTNATKNLRQPQTKSAAF